LKVFNFVVFALVLVLPLKGALSAAFTARARELEERLALAEKEKSHEGLRSSGEHVYAQGVVFAC